MTQDEARRLLQLPATFDSDALRTAYREAVKATHPDQGGNAQEFQRVRSAYLLLQEYATSEAKASVPRTIDGRPLTELGNRSEFAADCERCDGRGWKVVYRNPMVYRCHHCAGLGFEPGPPGAAYARLCGRCFGAGVVWLGRVAGRDSKMRDAGREFHVCEACEGTGERAPFNTVIPKGAILR